MGFLNDDDLVFGMDDDDDEQSSFLRDIDDVGLKIQARELLDAGLDLFDLETQDGEDLWETVRDLGLDPNNFRLEDLAAEAGNYTTVPDWDPSEDDRMHKFSGDNELLRQARALVDAGLDLDDLEYQDGESIWETVRDLGLDPNDYRLEDLAEELDNFTTVPAWDPKDDDRLHSISDDDLLEQARALVDAGLDLDDLETQDGPTLFLKVYRLGLDPDAFDLEDLAAELGNYIDIPD